MTSEKPQHLSTSTSQMRLLLSSLYCWLIKNRTAHFFRAVIACITFGTLQNIFLKCNILFNTNIITGSTESQDMDRQGKLLAVVMRVSQSNSRIAKTRSGVASLFLLCCVPFRCDCPSLGTSTVRRCFHKNMRWVLCWLGGRMLDRSSTWFRGWILRKHLGSQATSWIVSSF